ncbi:MAG TPA: YfiR family protein [Gemmatimonadaceae bacterium]|nr:YfiR family protein [Gemmatimonadaceae bacterium]
MAAVIATSLAVCAHAAAHPDQEAAREHDVKAAFLFVGEGESDRGGEFLAAVEDLPVFTVGDSSKFAERGGDIGFVLEERR